MLRFGHRGAAGYAPENTLAAIQKALSLGVDGIEIDVRAVDGKIILLHDDTLNRTTNGRGFVTDYRFDELRKLDAGDGEKIPLLEEVLELIDGRVLLNIEIKGTNVIQLLHPLVTRCLEEGYPKDALLISSFDHRQLTICKKTLPHVPVGALIYGIPHDLAQVGATLDAYSLHISREYAATDLIVDAHRKGMQVYVYTVNEPHDLTVCEALGVDGVFSDFPDRVAYQGE